MIEIRGVKEEWWEQRVKFLVSRAETHLDRGTEGLHHRACAATLLRDAGCLLLLREQFGRGRQRLAQAGEHLVEMGLAAGLVLISMHDVGRAGQALNFHRETDENARRRTMGRQADAPERGRESVRVASRNSLSSMLSVVQADLLQAVAGAAEVEWASERRETERRELEERHGAREVGETGLSVARYLRVAESMEVNAPGRPGDVPVEIVRALLGRRREERIDAVRRDEFHWRRVPRPAELLDLDCVVLMQVALAGGCEEEALREWTGWRSRDVLGAPLDVAKQLQGPVDAGHSGIESRSQANLDQFAARVQVRDGVLASAPDRALGNARTRGAFRRGSATSDACPCGQPFRLRMGASAGLTNHHADESVAVEATPVMDTLRLIERVEEDASRTVADRAVRETCHVHDGGETATMAEVAFRRPDAESVNTTLPTSVHVFTVDVV